MFTLLADDIKVWEGMHRPLQAAVDHAAAQANRRGWNGTLLELQEDGEYVAFLYPTEHVLS